MMLNGSLEPDSVSFAWCFPNCVLPYRHLVTPIYSLLLWDLSCLFRFHNLETVDTVSSRFSHTVVSDRISLFLGWRVQMKLYHISLTFPCIIKYRFISYLCFCQSWWIHLGEKIVNKIKPIFNSIVFLSLKTETCWWHHWHLGPDCYLSQGLFWLSCLELFLVSNTRCWYQRQIWPQKECF